MSTRHPAPSAAIFMFHSIQIAHVHGQAWPSLQNSVCRDGANYREREPLYPEKACCVVGGPQSAGAIQDDTEEKAHVARGQVAWEKVYQWEGAGRPRTQSQCLGLGMGKGSGECRGQGQPLAWLPFASVHVQSRGFFKSASLRPCPGRGALEGCDPQP